MQGPAQSMDCVACISKRDCPFSGECAFAAMWNQVNEAMFKIYDETTIQDLIERERKKAGAGVKAV
jgi:DNA-binding IscR family transcriptional regulator